MTFKKRKIAVLGAGVIGQVYAARLHEAGADVTLLARGKRLAELQAHGVRYRCEYPGLEERIVPVPVADIAEPFEVDVVLVAVRSQDLRVALEAVARMGKPIVVTLMHLGGQRAELERTVDP
ncbi:ketopantoate reductase family protein [Tersicoccus phoenicis]|nr:2-dehydropantoate 2-reductase N-terminal domain-containing protein [Tersicoccus phoenicis]